MKYIVRASVIEEVDKIFIVDAIDDEDAALKVEQSSGTIEPSVIVGSVTDVEAWDISSYVGLEEHERLEIDELFGDIVKE